MASETKTTSLPGIANSIRAKSYEYFAQTGVMKALVTKLTGVGTQFEEPYFDPTATSGVASTTEGTDYSTLREVTTTRRTYTASEWIMMSFMTDQSRKMSLESVKEFHSKTHGYEHGYNLESKLLGTFASFTTSVTATNSTNGLTWAKIAAARTRLEDIAKSAPKPYSLVTSADAWYYFAAGTTGGAAGSPYYVSGGTVADALQQKYYVSSLIGGINCYQTSGLTATSLQNCGLFSKDAIGLFMPSDLDYRLETQRDASKRGDELVSTMTYGARVRVPTYGIKVVAYASQPS